MQTTYEIGLTIGAERGVYNVDSVMLRDHHTWEDAVQTVLDMAQALYPDKQVEFDFVKEYDSA